MLSIRYGRVPSPLDVVLVRGAAPFDRVSSGRSLVVVLLAREAARFDEAGI
jgi:hypothetical protein